MRGKGNRIVFQRKATELDGYNIPITVSCYIEDDGIKWQLMGSTNLMGAFVCDGTHAYQPQCRADNAVRVINPSPNVDTIDLPWRIDDITECMIAQGKFIEGYGEPQVVTGRMERLPLRIVITRLSVEIEDNNVGFITHAPDEVYAYDMKPYHDLLGGIKRLA